MTGQSAKPADSAKEKRAAERERRRQEMIDGAVAAVRRDGPMVSMEQIAAECGVTKPIIYRHFGDRDGLLLEIGERFVDELVEEMSPALLRDDAPPIDLLTATMDAYLALIERDTNLYRFLMSHAGADRRDLFVGMVAEQIAIVLEHRLHERHLDTASARTWAYGLVGMVHLAGDWWVAEQSISRDELVRQLSTLLWVGFDRLGFGEQRPDPVSQATLERSLDASTRRHQPPKSNRSKR